MNTREAAAKWNVKPRTVAEYCNQGLIPAAEKIKKLGRLVWEIPEDCVKPPMSRHGFCFLISQACLIKNGGDYQQVNWNYPLNTVIDGYKYWASNLFINSFDEKNMENAIKNFTITKRGLELIRKENASQNDLKVDYDEIQSAINKIKKMISECNLSKENKQQINIAINCLERENQEKTNPGLVRKFIFKLIEILIEQGVGFGVALLMQYLI